MSQKFNANKISIKSLLSNNSILFSISIYQRGYSWKEKDVTQFFQDLIVFSKKDQI